MRKIPPAAVVPSIAGALVDGVMGVVVMGVVTIVAISRQREHFFVSLSFQVPFPVLCFVQVKRYLVEHSGDNIQYIWIDVSCIDVSVLLIWRPCHRFMYPRHLLPGTIHVSSGVAVRCEHPPNGTMCIFDSSPGSPVSLLLRLPIISLSFYLCLFLSFSLLS